MASLAPNLEHNERQTVLLIGDFGNRIEPGLNGSRHPVSVRVVNDNTPFRSSLLKDLLMLWVWRLPAKALMLRAMVQKS